MTYTDIIKNGFRLINRNWPLVLIQLSMVFLSTIGFFIIVGIPLAIAFVIFGIDLTELTDMRDIFKIFKGPSILMSKYLGLFLIVLVSFLLYLLLITMVGIYVFGGSIGVIGRSLKDASLKFSMRIFFDEAKKIFLRLLGFTSVIGLILIVIAFFLGMLGGGIAAIVSYAQSQDSTLALFFGTFFSLILLVIALVLIIGILSITLYGIAALFFKDTGAVQSIKVATQFLIQHPNAFWLYTILFVGYLIASFLMILLGYPFTVIPIIGTILSFPYQIAYYAFETYLGLMIIATILSYYYTTEFPSGPVDTSIESPIPQPEQEEKSTAQDTEEKSPEL
jgi:hypothetical protein